MQRSAEVEDSVQKAIDWAVFSVGAFALVTAIAATVVGSGNDRFADAATQVQTTAI